MNQDPISKNLIKNNRQKVSTNLFTTQKVIKNQVVAATFEAARILEETNREAERIRREAEIEAENLREAAYLQGTEEAVAVFEINLLDARDIRERILRETEKDLLRLAVRLAEKIIGREIANDKKVTIDIVSTALQNARQQEKLTVRVSPTDLPTVENATEKFSSSGRIKFIDFVADPRVSVGGCLIESEVGTIDARLETQLRVLERALLSQSEGEITAE